ncbi:hypothetical protein PALI_a0367 [Pseudoalteromonas aliena SW19]|uniref:Uncharacterized protein n=1 Tax=Pseudoalteromonas aliena SW19 TaxID=1314866 RepID=A0ABR9DXR2_9GAMM|nr:hypothetical protein [Pseudoalteromonas aliena SW19]
MCLYKNDNELSAVAKILNVHRSFQANTIMSPIEAGWRLL